MQVTEMVTKMPYVDGLIRKQEEKRALITSNSNAGIPQFSSCSSDDVEEHRPSDRYKAISRVSSQPSQRQERGRR